MGYRELWGQRPAAELSSAFTVTTYDRRCRGAGLVVRNVRLTAELRLTIDEPRASRRRLVEAQDSERPKIERNLHDGAQQRLVALGVQLGLLERTARDQDWIETLGDAIPSLRAPLQDAPEELRDLARDLPAPAGRSRSRRRARRAGGEGSRPDGRRRGRDRSVRSGGRGRPLLLRA